MAATPSVKVTKSFAYQGVTKLWSNRYHFNGGTPADTTHWNTFFDAVVAAEKAIFNTRVTIVRCDGYAAGSDVPAATKTYAQAGTWAFSPIIPQDGEVAALARWSTTARTSKNHPIYLFSYWHAVESQGTGTPDQLNGGQKTAMTTYATAWVSGFSDGTNTYVRAGPNGATGVSPIVETYMTVHTFPR